MTINYLKIKGLLTVNLTDGMKIGEIAGFRFDYSKRLKQLVLKSDNEEYVVVDSDSIKGIGSAVAIVDLKNSPVGISASEASDCSLINQTTISPSGEYIGKVFDFTLDTVEKQVISLEVKSDDTDTPMIIDLDHIHTLGKDFVIIIPAEDQVNEVQEPADLDVAKPSFENDSLSSPSTISGVSANILSNKNIDAWSDLSYSNQQKAPTTVESRDQSIQKYRSEIIGKTQVSARDFVDSNDITLQQVAFYDDGTDNFKGQLESYDCEQQAKVALETEVSEDADISRVLSIMENEVAQEKAAEYGVENEKLINPAKVQKLDAQPLTSPGLRMTKVDLKFDTDYAKVMKLIEAISKNSEKIGLETIILKSNPENEEDEQQQLTCNLVMFVPVLDLADGDYSIPASILEDPTIPSWYKSEVKDPSNTVDTLDKSEPSTDDWFHSGEGYVAQ